MAGDQAVDLLPEMKLAPEPLDAVEGALDAEAFGRAGFTVIGVGRPVRNALTPAWR